MKSQQPKKRLIIDVSPAQHEILKQRASDLGISISNMVRRALMLPEDQQGRRHDAENKSQ